MKIDFKNISDGQFKSLEESAIDGSLIYDSFPPEEYVYFSKLSKLGYFNRHKGWSKEICEEKQKDFKREYLSNKEKNNRFFCMACKMQSNIRKGEMMICKIGKSKSDDEKLKYALQAIELMTCQDGFAKRQGSQYDTYAGCDLCNGILDWSEIIGNEEVKFNFCPVCGREIKEAQH